MKYVIKWTAKKSGATGYSTRKFTLEQAQRLADRMNNEEAGCVHTVVPYTKKPKDMINERCT